MMLDELRQHIMHADDWLHNRTPETAVMAKLDMRGSRAVLAALKESYSSCEADAIMPALRLLAKTCRAQITGLHGKFGLARPLASDLGLWTLFCRATPTDRPKTSWRLLIGVFGTVCRSFVNAG